MEQCKRLKKASLLLEVASTKDKNIALEKVIQNLIKNTPFILEENAKDIKFAKESGIKAVSYTHLCLFKGGWFCCTAIVRKPKFLTNC